MMVDKNLLDGLNSSLEQLLESLPDVVNLDSRPRTEQSNPMMMGWVDRDTGMGRILTKLRTTMLSGSDVTGGDLDDNLYQAEVVGEEAVGGQAPTPDQNVTED